MKKNTYYLLFFFLIFGLWACEEPSGNDDIEDPEITLSASPLTFTFSASGGTDTIEVTSNGTWTIHYETGTWFYTSLQTVKGDARIILTVEENPLEEIRTGNITITADGAGDITISISQEAKIVEETEPEWIEPDNTGMESNALTIASKIYLGWNLGNTLESTGGETAWGNPKASNELIVAVKNAGFNAIRIPCAWDQYIENKTTYKIKDSWLARVQEVVDYCVNNDMYAILNIHWDGGWLENNCTSDKQEEVNKEQAVIWKQIAIYFRNYDEHLLFAGANEPNAENQEQVNVLNTYLQTFVDTVRGTGGRNAYRNLIIQAPYTDIDRADQYMTMPTDAIENRLLAEVHYYTPWQFCGMTEDASWGKMFYFWGEPYHLAGAEDRYPNWDCEENYMEAQFQKMKTKFVDNDIPLILGEFGAISRTLTESELWQETHDNSRAYFYKNIAERAKNNGLVPFFWDNGSGIFDRTSNTISDQKAYDGLIDGANNGTYPF